MAFRKLLQIEFKQLVNPMLLFANKVSIITAGQTFGEGGKIEPITKLVIKESFENTRTRLYNENNNLSHNDIKNIYSSTGNILITLCENNELIELVCSEMETIENRTGAIWHYYRVLKSVRKISHDLNVLIERNIIKQFKTDDFIINDWQTVKCIEPYAKITRNASMIIDRHSESYKAIEQSLRYGTTIKIRVNEEERYISFTIQEEKSTRPQSDRDGGYYHKVTTYTAATVKLFSTTSELRKYLGELRCNGIDIESGFATYNMQNTNINELERIYQIRFSFSKSEDWEDCTYDD